MRSDVYDIARLKCQTTQSNGEKCNEWKLRAHESDAEGAV